MADVAVNEAQDGDQAQQVLTEDMVKKMVSEQVEEVRQQYKAEIAGLNRKVSEKDQALEEKEQVIEKEKLTANQRIERLEQENAQERAERKKATLDAFKTDVMSELKLTEFAADISGDTPEQIRENAEAFQKKFQSKLTAEVEARLVSNGKPPGSGEGEIESKDLMGLSRKEFLQQTDPEQFRKQYPNG